MKRLIVALLMLMLSSPAMAVLAFKNDIVKVGNVWGDVQCWTSWQQVDLIIYTSLSVQCDLYYGPIGPTVPNNIAYQTYYSELLNGFYLTPVGVEHETGTILPGCGDLKWKLESQHSWVTEPDDCAPAIPGVPCNDGVARVKVKAITWIQ